MSNIYAYQDGMSEKPAKLLNLLLGAIMSFSAFFLTAPWEGGLDQSAHAQRAGQRAAPGHRPGIGLGLDLGLAIGRTITRDNDRGRRPPPRARRQIQRRRPPVRRAVRRAVPRRFSPPIPQYNRGEIIVGLARGVSDGDIAALARSFGLTRAGDVEIALLSRRIMRFILPAGMTPERVLQLAGDARVAFAQPNYRYRLSAGNIPQYALAKLRILKTHKAVKGKGIIIGVVDSGVNSRHPALKGAVIDRFNAVGKGAVSNKVHGTGIASIIAARAGMIGVAPRAKILSAMAFANDTSAVSRRDRRRQTGSTFNLLRGVDWAVARGAQILNLSFAGPDDPVFHRILQAAFKRGVISIAAAGNQGAKAPPAYPAAYREVIAVTATDAKNRLYRHANRGGYIEIAAPGVDILVARRNRSYGFMSGTSASSAYISGAIALLLQARPNIKFGDIINHLAISALDLGAKGKDPKFGHGLLDVYRAVNNGPKAN